MALVKVSVLIAGDIVEDMERRAREQGITMTELIKQALALQKFLDAERARGSKVIYRRADGSEGMIIR